MARRTDEFILPDGRTSSLRAPSYNRRAYLSQEVGINFLCGFTATARDGAVQRDRGQNMKKPWLQDQPRTASTLPWSINLIRLKTRTKEAYRQTDKEAERSPPVLPFWNKRAISASICWQNTSKMRDEFKKVENTGFKEQQEDGGLRVRKL